jgi:hypothetical protein
MVLPFPEPMVQVTCMVNPFSLKLKQEGNALVGRTKSLDLQAFYQIFLSGFDKMSLAKTGLRDFFGGNVRGKYIANLSILLCERKDNRGKMVRMAMGGKYKERFFPIDYRKVPFEIIKQQIGRIGLKQKGTMVDIGYFHTVKIGV